MAARWGSTILINANKWLHLFLSGRHYLLLRSFSILFQFNYSFSYFPHPKIYFQQVPPRSLRKGDSAFFFTFKDILWLRNKYFIPNYNMEAKYCILEARSDSTITRMSPKGIVWWYCIWKWKQKQLLCSTITL